MEAVRAGLVVLVGEVESVIANQLSEFAGCIRNPAEHTKKRGLPRQAPLRFLDVVSVQMLVTPVFTSTGFCGRPSASWAACRYVRST